MVPRSDSLLVFSEYYKHPVLMMGQASRYLLSPLPRRITSTWVHSKPNRPQGVTNQRRDGTEAREGKREGEGERMSHELALAKEPMAQVDADGVKQHIIEGRILTLLAMPVTDNGRKSLLLLL
jgi:hypothetical protein